MTFDKALTDQAKPARSNEVRNDYRCKAHGCPNAGSIEDLCYWHWAEGDSLKWADITTRIRNNFETMRNFGPPMKR